MSNSTFPSLVGLTWDIKKRPTFSNLKQRTASLRETRVMMAEFPIYEWDLHYDVLRQDTVNADFNTLIGFFRQMYGDWDTFLFTDLSDYTVTDQAIGIGDGSTKIFQLVRTQGGFAEPVYDVMASPTPVFKVNAVVEPSWSLDYTTGLLTFVSAPGNGLAITGTFQYYWRTRFRDSMTEFNWFQQNFWENQEVDLTSVLP